MHRSHLLLAATLLGLALAPLPQMPAAAECAGPYLADAERLVLQRRTTVTIRGRAFVDGCRDSMTCSAGPGCDACEYDEPTELPMEDVSLRLVQRDRTWDLDVADAGTAADDELGWVTWTFELPADAEPGGARLLADGASPVRVRVR